MDLGRFSKDNFLAASESAGRGSWEKIGKIPRDEGDILYISPNTEGFSYIYKWIGGLRGEKVELNKIKYLHILSLKGGNC